MNKGEIKNKKIQEHNFLTAMYTDAYFPTFLVDKIQAILIELCISIESKNPENLKELYVLTHHATEKINNLEEEFYANESELETGAREAIGAAFEWVANAYNFDADIEELIAPREW